MNTTIKLADLPDFIDTDNQQNKTEKRKGKEKIN